MSQTIQTIRVVFFLLCIFSSYLICYTVAEWDKYRGLAIFIGASIGGLVILVDIFLKGFSLRGLTALTFGIFIGWLNAWFLSSSPLFEGSEPEILFIVRLATFVILMYIGAVVALRGKDEFNLVIPYVRFVPHGVEVPLAVVDTSALIDGRIVGICQSRFMGYALVVPSFVVDELQRVADSKDPMRQVKGRKGLESLRMLRKMEFLDLRIHESDVEKTQNVENKLIYLARSLKARILTTDYNLAQIAEFHGLEWLNINVLVKAMNPEVVVGETVEIDLVKRGKEAGQAVGFLPDGSMVVVNNGAVSLGRRVVVEVKSVIPSSGGKMIFGNLLEDSQDTVSYGVNEDQ